MNLRAFVSSLRHPAFTGPARNPGFVVANIVVASLLAVAVDWAIPLSGSVVVGVALVLLTVRGYAVPGTPTLLSVVGRWTDVSAAGGPPASVDVRRLCRAGVLERRGSRLRLTDAFATAWWERVADAGPRWADERQLAAALDVPPEEVDLHWGEQGRVLVAWVAGEPKGVWLSRAALVADIASVDVLARSSRWQGSPPRLSGSTLSTVRRALDRCPACDGRLRHERVTSRLHDTESETDAVTCLDCDARVFEEGFDARGLVSAGDRSPSVVGP
jgi:hypothetical protein